MGNAKFIGHVGALAVALGIGTAVATTPWIAVAEPSDSDSSSESSSSEPSSSAGESSSANDSNPASSVDTSADTGTSADMDTPADTSDGAGHTDEESEASTDGDLSATPETPDPAPENPAETESATDPESNTSDQPETQPDAEPAAVTEPSDNHGPSAQPVSVGVPQASMAASVTSVQRDAPEPVARTTEAETPVDAPIPASAAFSAVQMTVVEDQAVPAQMAVPSAPVTGLVSTVLAWVGFGPALNTPAAPVQSPGLLGLLSWIGHEIRRTFFNQTPTTAYDPVENSQAVDGVVTGDLHAVDADGDPLRFTVTEAPQNGSVVINPDGTFAYTPSAQLAATGGTDVFTVKVGDEGFHLHGLSGLLNLITFGLFGDSGHSSTATVTLTVQPINQPPQVGNPGFTIDNVDADTGVVTGTVNITDPDPDGDSLAYSHGSRATDTARTTSDIDIAAHLGGRRTRAFEILLPSGVDLLVLDDAPLELAGGIAVRGRLLFEADPQARVVWEATTRKIYFDELPRISRAHREFAEAMRRGR